MLRLFFEVCTIPCASSWPVSDPVSRNTILVVDDHPDILAFMRAALEGAGYEVYTASEGGQALADLRRRRADLLITDIFMPGQEGFQTITRCKAEFPQTRIIVMSAGTIPGMEHDFLATASHLGVGATLRKPFTADRLLDTVHRVLQYGR
jgi:DNA-binding NtrC family response regulator